MSWDHELQTMTDAVQAAGEQALRLARDGFETSTKTDRSPVTSADHAVNDLLHERLLGAFPDDGWLSEETPDTSTRLTKPRVWIIDPIDGTRAFMRGIPEFCISVALVEGHVPVVAGIYNPSTDELFTASRGAGVRLNGVPINAPIAPPDVLMLVSTRELHMGRFRSVEPWVRCAPIRSIAFALALTAVGRVDAMVTFERENEWDLAAGALLIGEAGGTVVDASGQRLQFNRPQPMFTGTIAIAPRAQDRVGPVIDHLRRFMTDRPPAPP
jgi:myo-inositol-1(or 4)-monophosphatase